MKTIITLLLTLLIMNSENILAQKIIYGDQNENTNTLINSIDKTETENVTSTSYYVVDEDIPNTFSTGNNTVIVCRLSPGSDTNILCSSKKPDNGWGTMVLEDNESFNYLENPTSGGSNIYSIVFTDPDNGWAVGMMERNSMYTSVIFNTVDGGNTWKLQFTGGSGMNLNSIYFIDPKNGWTLGKRKVGDANFDIVLVTTDGGENWNEQNLAQLNHSQKPSNIY